MNEISNDDMNERAAAVQAHLEGLPLAAGYAILAAVAVMSARDTPEPPGDVAIMAEFSCSIANFCERNPRQVPVLQ